MGEETLWVARTRPRKGFECRDKDLESRSTFSGD